MMKPSLIPMSVLEHFFCTSAALFLMDSIATLALLTRLFNLKVVYCRQYYIAIFLYLINIF